MEDKSLQNNDITLPGGIGTVNGREIIKSVSDFQSGTLTLTIAGKRPEIIDNSNCVFDVKMIEDRLKELGALEDIKCEILQPKQIDNG